MDNINHNPDVLNCLANLSNDEVFTPPHIANQVIDLLPAKLFTDKSTTFLDPFSKSGVFLREITKRLIKGLENEIPDLQTRIDHILNNQIFGITTTELTGYIARRTVYCAKYANSPKAITNVFDNPLGNIIYNQTKHTWKKGKCIFCGASEDVYKRDDALETHAYQFIHTDTPQDIFKMKFDVIIGNPPYQLEDGGAGSSASPIYHKFVEQAKKLNPRYLSMIIPARWYSGGKGLDEFRKEMLNDKRMKYLVDYKETKEVFSGLNIRGGICYFLWAKDYNGDCYVKNINADNNDYTKRPLLEGTTNIFIRHNQAISILDKIKEITPKLSFMSLVSSRKPFGLATNYIQFSKEKTVTNNIKLYRFGEAGYINSGSILNNKAILDQFKIIVPKASPGGDDYPHAVLGKPIISEPNSVCTETYIVIGAFENEKICKNVCSYIKTRFFRFLVILIKNTQDVPKRVYQFVPMQDFNESWTDEKLYKKYDLTPDEIGFIETLVRPMD